MPREFLRSLARLGGKTFGLLRNNGEPAAGFAGAGGFDGRVECEKIGLRGNAADEIADLADFVDRRRQACNGIGNGLGLVGCLRRAIRRNTSRRPRVIAASAK